jgi:hypothetical protein
MANQVKVTPEEFAARWGQGLKQSVERIRSGVGRVTESPGRSAARSADKWHAAISQVATKEKWARRTGAMTLEDWQAAMIDKGVNRIATGVDSAQGKMAEYGAKLIAHQNALLAELDGMADVTLEDSISRATHWIRGMAKLTV